MVLPCYVALKLYLALSSVTEHASRSQLRIDLRTVRIPNVALVGFVICRNAV